ncbi:uncharacterized protein LOC133842209 [Drosophila sulfurigaster albostrigata]|uniref:uncharacterized protein LOC133842209 n=1 Tax=Drosophila sulfurigaster albostrigata TaxID=89887 RepID=UPI002D21C653|nr:uncharacterized protein LOC133842209 [Drosophila sulfurigaster albostrigata]
MYSAKQISLVALVIAQLLGAIQCGIYDYTDTWVLSDKTKNFPDNAVLGGFDPNGYDNFVGRVVYSSSILPARIVAETGSATYNTESLANTATSYELLVANDTMSYHWIHSYDGYREKNAVSVGTSYTNERVYVCRCRTDGALFIGTLYPAQRTCIVRYGNLPLRQLEKYEVLVRKTKLAKLQPLLVQN